MTNDLPNLWTTRDLPVLIDAARQLDVEHRQEVDRSVIVERIGLAEADVLRALLRLYEAEYVSGFDASSVANNDVIVTGMTERGYREVGMWPSSTDGRALIEVIEQAAEQETDDDKRGALRELLRSARNVSEGTLGSIAATVVTRLTLGT